MGVAANLRGELERANPRRRRRDRALPAPGPAQDPDRKQIQWLSAQPLRVVSRPQSHGRANALIHLDFCGDPRQMKNQPLELELGRDRQARGYPGFSRRRRGAPSVTVLYLDFGEIERGAKTQAQIQRVGVRA